MGLTAFPLSSTSVIKSIQRGVAVSAGDITISAINVDKTRVSSFSTGASGTVAGSGTISGPSATISGKSVSPSTIYYSGNSTYGANAYRWPSSYGSTPTRYSYTQAVIWTYISNSPVISTAQFAAANVNGSNINFNATNITAGSTNLIAATNGIYIKNSTTITATGPCRYEVIEYY